MIMPPYWKRLSQKIINGKMNQQSQLFFDDKQHLMVQGELTVDTVSDLLNTAAELFRTQIPQTVDMRRVEQVDSAGFVWLIHLIRLAQAQVHAIHFIHAPEAVFALMELSGLEQDIGHYFTALK